MTPLEARFKAHPNGYGQRCGSPIDTIVLHTTQGSGISALRWFADPASKVSAHYVIGEGGIVYSVAPESAACWHAGNYRMNLRSIGIEVAGYAERADTWSPMVLVPLGMLIADLCKRHGIPCDRVHVIGHNEVPDPRQVGKFGGAGNHTDPGPHIPWDRIIEDARAILAAKEGT